MKHTILAILMLAAMPASAQESGQPALTAEQAAYQKAYAEAYTEICTKYPESEDDTSEFSKELNRRYLAMIKAEDPCIGDPRWLIPVADKVARYVATVADAVASVARKNAPSVIESDAEQYLTETEIPTAADLAAIFKGPNNEEQCDARSKLAESSRLQQEIINGAGVTVLADEPESPPVVRQITVPVAEPGQTSEQIAYDTAFNAAAAEARAKYPDLNDGNTALSKELDRRYDAVIAANDPRMQNPRFILALADAAYATLITRNAPAAEEAARTRATAIRQMERAMRTRKPDDEAKAMRMLATDAPDLIPSFNAYLAAKSGAAVQRQNDQIIRNQRDQQAVQQQILEQQQRQAQEQRDQAMRREQQERDRRFLENANRRR